MITSIQNVLCPQEIKPKRQNQGLKTEHKEIEIYSIEKLVLKKNHVSYQTFIFTFHSFLLCFIWIYLIPFMFFQSFGEQ